MRRLEAISVPADFHTTLPTFVPQEERKGTVVNLAIDRRGIGARALWLGQELD